MRDRSHVALALLASGGVQARLLLPRANRDHLDRAFRIRDRSRMDVEALEALAESILDELGFDAPPFDARELAVMYGLRLVPTVGVLGALIGDDVLFDPTLPQRTAQANITHEVAHAVAIDAGLVDTERLVERLSHALMMRRSAFVADLAETWSPSALQAKYVNAPASWIVRRICQLRPSEATATIVDDGHVRERRASSWLPVAARQAPTRWEQTLVAQALARGRLVEARGAWALPVLGPVRRVVTIAESAQVALAA